MLRKWPDTFELVLLIKLSFGFFCAKIPKSEMERASRKHFWRCSTSVGDGRNEIAVPILDKTVRCPTFHLFEELGKGMENGKSLSSWLTRFERKMSFQSR